MAGYQIQSVQIAYMEASKPMTVEELEASFSYSDATPFRTSSRSRTSWAPGIRRSTLPCPSTSSARREASSPGATR